MVRRRESPSSYHSHSETGRSCAVWTDLAGRRDDCLLPGRCGSKESRQAYTRLLREL